jgi:hypothetical protein
MGGCHARELEERCSCFGNWERINGDGFTYIGFSPRGEGVLGLFICILDIRSLVGTLDILLIMFWVHLFIYFHCLRDS